MTKSQKRKLFTTLCALIIIGIAYVFNYVDKSSAMPDTNTEPVIKIDGEELQVYYLNVGQADSIFIKDQNKSMLIDAGNNEDGQNIVDYLKELGISKIDYVIGTHAHEDHIGGMDDIIRNFEIERFYMPDAVTTTKTFEEVLDSLEEKSIEISIPKEDEELTLTNAKIKFLYSGTNTSDLNNTSIVLKLTYGNNKFLFMGDATDSTEKKILNKDLKSDVLKVGHHGSQYSSTEEFLDKVNPTYAIISVGTPNSYDHPKEITLTKLKERNIKLYRTDQDGTIIATSDGNNIKFTTNNIDLDGR